MTPWIDAVSCMFMNPITNFLFYFKKLKNCISKNFLTE